MSVSNHVMLLPKDKIEKASKVAARAFQDDPLYLEYYPDSIEREIKNYIRCKNMILVGILSGEVYTTSENLEGIAVWNPYGIKDFIIGKQSKEIIRESRKIRREMFSDPVLAKKISNSMEIYSSLQNKYANFPHWYLTMIAVDPQHQKKGYASMLLKAKLKELDKQNLPCYLNAQSERNITLYENFGFKIVAKTKIPKSAFYYYGMLRKME